VTGTAPKRRFDSRRVYVALVFVPLFYALVRHAPSVGFFGLVALAALIAVWEFYRLSFHTTQASPLLYVAGGAATALLLATAQWPDLLPERAMLIGIMMVALCVPLIAQRAQAHGLTDPALLAFGPLYIGLALSHLLLTRALADGEWLIFFVVLVTWAGDTGAYYTGMSLGRHKLAPAISPNKTIEGLAGGLALAVLAAFVAREWFLPSLTSGDCLATGLLLTAAGVAGDLAESALKRGAGVKDSGALLPGHGGVLDRLDSLLFTAPVFYYYVTLVKG
jgi:phosphatidate cytidylyltransferase